MEVLSWDRNEPVSIYPKDLSFDGLWLAGENRLYKGGAEKNFNKGLKEWAQNIGMVSETRIEH